jgi:hypothetical protein
MLRWRDYLLDDRGVRPNLRAEACVVNSITLVQSKKSHHGSNILRTKKLQCRALASVPRCKGVSGDTTGHARNRSRFTPRIFHKRRTGNAEKRPSVGRKAVVGRAPRIDLLQGHSSRGGESGKGSHGFATIRNGYQREPWGDASENRAASPCCLPSSQVSQRRRDLGHPQDRDMPLPWLLNGQGN